MYEYWRGLIALRKSEIGSVFRIGEKPSKNYYKWIEPDNPKLLGYIVRDKFFVLINTDTVRGVFNNITLPDSSTWRLIGNIREIRFNQGIDSDKDSVLAGGQNYDLELSAESLKIWINR
jgi:hypothetical protein